MSPLTTSWASSTTPRGEENLPISAKSPSFERGLAPPQAVICMLGLSAHAPGIPLGDGYLREMRSRGR